MRRLGLLFDYDWDALAHARHRHDFRLVRSGFDLFSFPSNARLVGFDLNRYTARLAHRARRQRWAGVLSHHEQFGALAASLVAERAGLPGARPESIVMCQHKLVARQLLRKVAPHACPDFAELEAVYGGPIPEGLRYPIFVKPVKAAFSVLASRVANHNELVRFTRFGRRELWVIRRLVEPFERISRERLGLSVPTAHRMMLETPVQAPQFNLDGWMHNGQLQVLGFMDAVMYPGTQSFMRFESPSRLDPQARGLAMDVAQRFLQAAGFDHGFFNMEFFFDASTRSLTVIEFNPRLASQFGDLYRRNTGQDAHRMAMDLAVGNDPRKSPVASPTAGASASFVYRAFKPEQIPTMPTRQQEQALHREFPDALLMVMPKKGHGLMRDFKWLGSHRYGILHLGGRDALDLRQRCERASAILGWPAPYALPADAPRASMPAFQHLAELST